MGIELRFDQLDLSVELFSAIKSCGFEECTPIQAGIIPLAQAGKDVAGHSPTGSGKTAAFLIPLMDRILKARGASSSPAETSNALSMSSHSFYQWSSGNFVLVLVPTRELAEQVRDHFQSLCGESGLSAVLVYGGVSYDKQRADLSQPYQFIIATPGRLIDLYKGHLIDLRQVRAVVFDEADRMFDMGFKDDMKYVLQRLPKDRQFLVFSATLNFEVLNVAYQFHAHPIEVEVGRESAKAPEVSDFIFHVSTPDKPKYLLSLLKKQSPKQAIVFNNFKMNVASLADFLSENGFPAIGISSLLSQSQRNRVIEKFRGEAHQNILVATDLAARGLDIKGVDLVINYDLPDDPEVYVHRIGRTGRAGEKGIAISLASDRDVEALERIENYVHYQIAVGWLEDHEFVSQFSPLRFESRRFIGPTVSEFTNSKSDQKSEKRSRPRSNQNSSTQRAPRTTRSQSSLEPNLPKPRKDPGPGIPKPRDLSPSQRVSSKQEPVHRDRVSGRHEFASQPSRTAHGRSHNKRPDIQQSQSTNRPGAGPRYKSSHGSSQQRRHSRDRIPRGIAPKTSSSILGKIGKLFKKLIGS